MNYIFKTNFPNNNMFNDIKMEDADNLFFITLVKKISTVIFGNTLEHYDITAKVRFNEFFLIQQEGKESMTVKVTALDKDKKGLITNFFIEKEANDYVIKNINIIFLSTVLELKELPFSLLYKQLMKGINIKLDDNAEIENYKVDFKWQDNNDEISLSQSYTITKEGIKFELDLYDIISVILNQPKDEKISIDNISTDTIEKKLLAFNIVAKIQTSQYLQDYFQYFQNIGKKSLKREEVAKLLEIVENHDTKELYKVLVLEDMLKS